MERLPLDVIQKLSALRRLNLKDNLAIWEEGTGSSDKSEGFESSKCFSVLSCLSSSLRELVVEAELSPAIALVAKEAFP